MKQSKILTWIFKRIKYYCFGNYNWLAIRCTGCNVHIKFQCKKNTQPSKLCKHWNADVKLCSAPEMRGKSIGKVSTCDGKLIDCKNPKYMINGECRYWYPKRGCSNTNWTNPDKQCQGDPTKCTQPKFLPYVQDR